MAALTKLSTKMSKQCQPADSKWDVAIVTASDELLEVEKRRKQLQRAIRLMRANKREGVAWPSAPSAPTPRGREAARRSPSGSRGKAKQSAGPAAVSSRPSGE